MKKELRNTEKNSHWVRVGMLVKYRSYGVKKLRGYKNQHPNLLTTDYLCISVFRKPKGA